ncbi:MAG TPA: hypothetical protein VF879_03000, partial [Nitrospirales bacterium]
MSRSVAESAALAAVAVSEQAARHKLRRFFDLLARLIITAGGLAVILSILGIFLFLIKEVAPLFSSAKGTQSGRFAAGSLPAGLPQAVLAGMDEQQEVAYLLKAGSADQLSFFSLPAGAPLVAPLPPALSKTQVTAIARTSGKNERFGLGTNDGRVIPLTMEFTAGYENGVRTIRPTVSTGAPVQIDPAKGPIVRLAFQQADAGPAAAILTEAGRLWFARVTPPRGADAEPTVAATDLTAQITGTVTALVLDGRGETLSIGTAGGNLYHYDVREGTQPILIETPAVAPPGIPVTALAYLIGDRSLVIGTGSGGVSVWMPVRPTKQSNSTRLQAIHSFASHPAAVTGISPSQRDKGFITGDAQGNLFVHYSTSAQTILKFSGNGTPLQSVMFAPKANSAVALTDTGQLLTYAIRNPHPETSFASLFRPVWYEGYEQPEHVWQSSGATDDFEAKFGLTPLLFGTLKGTIYAMLLA